MNITEKKNNFFTFLLILFPISLISGPLLPEIISFLLLIYFFINFSTFEKKNFFKDKIILFLFFYYIYLLVISFLKIELLEFLSDQFFYFRFILFSLAVYSLISINKNIFNYLGYCFVVLFFLLIVDVIVQYSFGKNIIGIGTFAPNRYSGLFGDELVLGGYLSRFFPLLIGLIYINEHFKFKNILIVFFLLTGCYRCIYIWRKNSARFNFCYSIFLIYQKRHEKKRIDYCNTCFSFFDYIKLL